MDAGGLDREFLLTRTRALHEEIRVAVAERLERARAVERPELASEPGAQGAGDVTYALDELAEEPLRRFVDAVAERQPVTLVAEGPGVIVSSGGGRGAPVRALVDPVDGTRSIMHDMRSAWALTGIAPDRGDETRLSQVEVAVQTELPTTSAAVYHVLTAVRGGGATIARHDVRTGRELERRPLRVRAHVPLENGYLCFARYLAAERPLVAELERGFLERAIAAHSLDPRLLYDDQYLCSAGQLHCVVTGRYRMLADLRGWLRETTGVANFTAKPYDLAALLVYEEAGVPVLDAAGRPLDAPFDTETPLSVVAFANAQVRAALEPHLRAAMDALHVR
ncbi:MAG: hypothetical protein H6825_07785 [Planctomycetes bacterium]|nr:hypothetical protein [Planctomycetota bacterium]